MVNILYEDRQIMVVVKPKGILSQADGSNKRDMLTEIKEYIKIRDNKPGNVYLGLVQRLDYNTSGIMVFAKTSKAAARLCAQIRNREIKKKYLAIVDGLLYNSSSISCYLLKNEETFKSEISDEKIGKKAILDYDVIEQSNGHTLVSVLLHTGRHHQIRASFGYIGHSLTNDFLYGSKTKGEFYLHAYYLSFIHPISKENLIFTNYPCGGMWDNYKFINLK